MAKPRPITIAPGLTLDGEALTFGEHGTDLDLVVSRAHSQAVRAKDDATAAEVIAACKLHAAALGAVLSLDPAVAALTLDTDPLTVGPILVAAVLRAAHAPTDPCALVLAVAEAARLHALATIPRNRDRLRALLAVPCTVEAAAWRPALLVGNHGSPATLAEREQAVRGHEAQKAAAAADFNAARAGNPERVAPEWPSVLPAVRLRGGLCRRSGVTLRPAGESSLAWAGAAWRVSCAALEGPRKMSEPKVSAAKIGELPVVCLFDGAPTTWGTMTPADLGEALKREAPVDTGTPDAFVARETLKRDEAFKIEGDASDLAMVADPSWTLYDVPEAQQAAVRWLAAALLAGDARAPDFERVRDDVRPALKEKRRRSRGLLSNSDRVQLWADALLAEVKRVQRIANDLKREEETRRRAEKLERSHAHKRAA